MNITMIGAGYVGLVSGACFADFGHDVHVIDNDASKIDALMDGVMPIYEQGLERLVAKNVGAGRLHFSTDISAAVAQASVVFIAVGTPSRRGDGHADLRYVYSAAREVARAMVGYTVVVNKSTVPVGTGDQVARIIRETNPTADFAVVSNPEFLREGSAIEDFKRPDRIVLGCQDQRSREVMEAVYRPLSLNKAPIVTMSRCGAELTKYAANAFLATKITFINEIADLCEAVGADVQDVARGIGLDKRIGTKFLHAGPGYGGSCFPKDTLALLKTSQDFGSPQRIVESVVAVNTARKRAMGRKIIAAIGGDVRGRPVALLGLTFKPNTDDMRDSPAIDIVRALQDSGAEVRAYDPEGMEQAQLVLDDVVYCSSPYEAMEGAAAVVLVTEWDSFRALNLDRARQLLSQPVMVDLRNVYPRGEVEAAGLRYTGIGR